MFIYNDSHLWNISIESHNGSYNQWIHKNRTTSLERTSAKATGGLKCILLVPNLHPRFCCYWSTKMLSLHGWYLTIAMYHHRETRLAKINALWWSREKGSHKVGAKETLKLSHGGPSCSQSSGTNPPIKDLRQSRHWVQGLIHGHAI